MAWSIGSNVTAGSVLTASRYNQDVLANLTELAPLFSAWTDYSPTWTQSATITHTKNHARYLQIGKMVMVAVKLTATGAGTATNQMSVTLPVNAARTGLYSVSGAGQILDANVNTNYVCAVAINDAGAVKFVHDTSGGNYFGGGPAVTAASGDIISFTVTYEAA